MPKRHLAAATLILLASCAPGPDRVVERRVADAPAARGETLLRTAMLDGHNIARAGLGLDPLVWDDVLADHARADAGYMARTGRFEHAPQPPGAGHEGENLFTGTRDAYAYREMVGYWRAEQANFVNAPVPTSSRTGKFADVGHYSQIVWRTTRRVGCALSSGATADYLVCRYAPSGNVVGYRAY